MTCETLTLGDRKQNVLDVLYGRGAGWRLPETGEMSGSLIPASAKVPEDSRH